MASLDMGGGGDGKSKQKKMNARVDFTPMVDMIMLLVTFFMLCTTLLKPQTMQISMPSDKDDIKQENTFDKEDVKMHLNPLPEFDGKVTTAELKPLSFNVIRFKKA